MISSSGSSVTGAGAGGSAHVHTRGGSVGSLSDTEVHADLLAIQFRVRHGISGFGGILNFVKSNESKASGSASFAIGDLLWASLFLRYDGDLDLVLDLYLPPDLDLDLLADRDLDLGIFCLL